MSPADNEWFRKVRVLGWEGGGRVSIRKQRFFPAKGISPRYGASRTHFPPAFDSVSAPPQLIRNVDLRSNPGAGTSVVVVDCVSSVEVTPSVVLAVLVLPGATGVEEGAGVPVVALGFCTATNVANVGSEVASSPSQAGRDRCAHSEAATTWLSKHALSPRRAQQRVSSVSRGPHGLSQRSFRKFAVVPARRQ